MQDGDNPNLVANNTIDNTVVADDQLTDSFILIVWHHPTEPREHLQVIESLGDTIRERAASARRESGHIVNNAAKLAKCYRRPADGSHSLISCLTAS